MADKLYSFEEIDQKLVALFSAAPRVPHPYSLGLMPSLIQGGDETEGLVGITLLFGNSEMGTAHWCFYMWDFQSLGRMPAAIRKEVIDAADRRFPKLPAFSLRAQHSYTFLDMVLLGCRRFRDWSVKSGQSVRGVSMGYNHASPEIFRHMAHRELVVNPQDPITRWDKWFMIDGETGQEHPLQDRILESMPAEMKN